MTLSQFPRFSVIPTISSVRQFTCAGPILVDEIVVYQDPSQSSRQSQCERRDQGILHVKFGASFVLPTPLYFATAG
jgi:hypothetical protein